MNILINDKDAYGKPLIIIYLDTFADPIEQVLYEISPPIISSIEHLARKTHRIIINDILCGRTVSKDLWKWTDADLFSFFNRFKDDLVARKRACATKKRMGVFEERSGWGRVHNAFKARLRVL